MLKTYELTNSRYYEEVFGIVFSDHGCGDLDLMCGIKVVKIMEDGIFFSWDVDEVSKDTAYKLWALGQKLRHADDDENDTMDNPTVSFSFTIRNSEQSELMNRIFDKVEPKKGFLSYVKNMDVITVVVDTNEVEGPDLQAFIYYVSGKSVSGSLKISV